LTKKQTRIYVNIRAALPVTMTIYDTGESFSFRNHNWHIVTTLQFLAQTIFDLKKKHIAYLIIDKESWRNYPH
jgi:hypothetical protein